MPKMKWDISGKGKGAATGEGRYSGPDLAKGSYPAKVKRVEVVKIQSTGENKNKPRLRVLLEVQTSQDEERRKFHGHPIWDGLNIIDGSEQFVNGFLHALTDGTQKAKDAIEAAFWDEDKGPDFRRIKNKKTGNMETHITKIGRVKIDSPNGNVLVQVTAKPGEYNGNFRAEVTGYIPFDPKSNPGLVNGVDKAEDEDEDDDLLSDADEEDDDVDDDNDDDVDDDEDEDEDEDDDYEDEDEEDDDEPDEDEDAKETAKSGSRRKRPF